MTQTYVPIVCPHCGADRPRMEASAKGSRYYRCRECDLDGTGGTPFKVPISEPAEPLRGLRSEGEDES